MMKVKGIFYGTAIMMNTWKPKVQSDVQFSVSQIWVVAGPNAELNTIEAGWNVNYSIS